MGYDWSGIARQQVQSGPQTIAVFAMGLLFVFLVLVAQYESLSTPFVIMLAVPLALLGAIGAIYVRRLAELLSLLIHSKLAGHTVPIPITSSDIYAQIGYIMLIGLAAKNAIFIVEFANQLREQGMDAVEAVAHAAATRLRPILMTSIAFILGIMPLAFAHGDGAQSRISLGTAVLGRNARFDRDESGDRTGALHRRDRAYRTRKAQERPDAAGRSAAPADAGGCGACPEPLDFARGRLVEGARYNALTAAVSASTEAFASPKSIEVFGSS